MAIDAEKKQLVAHEMADILIYLLRLSERLDVDLITAVHEKMALNEKRFPVEKVKGDARRGSEYD
jgi:NTP pyrophosphatase (non-canonical NTP hydrolase)